MESQDSLQQPLDSLQQDGDEQLTAQELEQRMAARVMQMVNELKIRLIRTQQQISDAQHRYAENQGSEEEVLELQGKEIALRETLLATMGQYSEMMQQRIALAGIIPMWADVEPGRLINIAA